MRADRMASSWSGRGDERAAVRSHVRGYALLVRLLLPGLALGGSTAGCGWLLGIEELAANDGGLPPPSDAPDASRDDAGDALQPDGDPPRVLSATPEPDAVGVATGVEIAVTFSEAIDPASIDAASFQLVDDPHGSAVLGTAIVEGAVVRFQPAAELTLRERYELVIGTAVTDLSGTPLAEEWRAAFSVREGVLGAAGSLTTGTVEPRAMGMGGRGEAFALWWDGGTIYSRHYQAGWQGTELVSNTGTPDNLTVAVGPEDAALAVWQAGTTRESAVYANDVVPWVESTLEGGGSPAQVGVDRRGFGLAAWLREEGTHTGVVASRFSGAQWSNPVRLDELDTNAGALHLAVDDAGNGVALWAQGDQIWTARFRDGAWEAAAVIEQPSGLAREPRMVMDSDGRGIAFWLQQDGPQYRMRWSSYDPRTGWSQPAFADGGPAIDPSNGTWHDPFAFNSHGDAVILRRERTSCGPESCNVLFADVFSLEQGWYDTQAISEAYSQFGFSEDTAVIDRHGNVQATWIVIAGVTTLELWLRRYVPAQGWQPAVALSCAEGSDFRDVDLIMSPQGRMLMSWIEDAGAQGYALCARMLD
jgi:Bacterial Ig-like domain